MRWAPSETPTAWCTLVRAHCTDATPTLAPLLTPHRILVPAAITPSPEAPALRLADAFEQIAGARDQFVRELQEQHGQGPTGVGAGRDAVDTASLVALLGAARAQLLGLLEQPADNAAPARQRPCASSSPSAPILRSYRGGVQRKGPDAMQTAGPACIWFAIGTALLSPALLRAVYRPPRRTA